MTKDNISTLKNRNDLISSLNRLLGRLQGGGSCSITVGDLSHGLINSILTEQLINSQINIYQKDIDRILEIK